MKTRKVRLQDLVGEVVHDVDGKRVGRVRSVMVERKGNECVVCEYRLGGEALLARFGLSALRLVGWPHSHEPIRVPWDQLDISDPEHPRLLCRKDELKGLAKGGK
jgi:sporulation protein YlmC with PRC-barrel domain